jgi:hypothetical protein
MGAHLGYIPVLKINASFLRFEITHDRSQRCRFTGAISTNEANHLSFSGL